jgi:hypothetical protein
MSKPTLKKIDELAEIYAGCVERHRDGAIKIRQTISRLVPKHPNSKKRSRVERDALLILQSWIALSLEQN